MIAYACVFLSVRAAAIAKREPIVLEAFDLMAAAGAADPRHDVLRRAAAIVYADAPIVVSLLEPKAAAAIKKRAAPSSASPASSAAAGAGAAAADSADGGAECRTPKRKRLVDDATELPTLVGILHHAALGMDRILEAFAAKCPDSVATKAALRAKVKDIADKQLVPALGKRRVWVVKPEVIASTGFKPAPLPAPPAAATQHQVPLTAVLKQVPPSSASKDELPKVKHSSEAAAAPAAVGAAPAEPQALAASSACATKQRIAPVPASQPSVKRFLQLAPPSS